MPTKVAEAAEIDIRTARRTITASPTGRRYLEGTSRILLFVRERKSSAVGTAQYLFLGPASLVEARGERPISIIWRLHEPMPKPSSTPRPRSRLVQCPVDHQAGQRCAPCRTRRIRTADASMR